jgi:hypothetical protein
LKVFLSWSGERSKAVAELLDEWIQCVIQAVDPWMSSKDIDRGSLWFSEVTDQLQNTSIGIICLTKENKNKPWILFEAGALAKGLNSSRVCTFLIDLEPTDVGNPLAQFNHTNAQEESMWALMLTLNKSLKERSLKEKVLEEVFETYWPKFEEKFQKIINIKEEVSTQDQRSENDILIEILSATRSMDRRIRLIEDDRHRTKSRAVPVASEAKAIILSLLKTGVDPVSILESALLQGVPRTFIKNEIARSLRQKERADLNEKDEGDELYDV